MANKKVSQLVSKPSVLVTDLFPIADPTTGQLFKTTISDLGTAIGSGVSSVNTLVGAVVLDTDDIQELASPTNRWFTDTRARAALSASSPLAYNSGTGVFSIAQANGSTNGFLSSADWTTFNAKQAALSGTGFVKISGTTISYDNSTYLTTSAAASTYLALAGGTLTGALNGTSATFTGDLTLSASNPRLYLTDTDNNPDYFISNTDGTFTIYDVTASTSRLTINGTTATLGANLTATSFIRSGGTSAQFLKADGSIDSSTYLTTSSASSTYVPYTGATGAVNLGIHSIGAQFGAFNEIVSNNNNFGDIGSSSNAFKNIYGYSFIKIGGTSAQFLKADGSIDSSTYLTTGAASSTYLPLTGGVMTGQIVLKEATSSTDYTKGLRFPNDPFTGSGDISGLRLYSSSGENQVLELYIGNDGGLGFDNINFATGVGGTANNDSVTINGNKIWNSGNLTPQTQLNGTGFVKASGTTITYDNTSYLPLGGGTLTGALSGTSATFSGLITGNYGGLFVIPTESPASGNVALIARTSNGNNDIFRWYDGATQLGVFKNSGSVGIGTASPSDFIDATSGLAVMASSGRAGITIGSTTTTADEVLGRLSFTNTNSTNVGSKRLAAISGLRGTTNNSAYLEFVVANDGLGAQVMTLNQSGYLTVGGLRLKGSDTANTIYNANSNMAITCESGYNISIGRSSDTTKSLNINTTNGNVVIGGVTTQNSATNRGNLTVNGTSSIVNLSISDINAGYLFHGGTDMLLVNAKNGSLSFYTNDNPRIIISNGGITRALRFQVGAAGLAAGNYCEFGNDDNVGYVDTIRAVNSGDFHFRFDGTSRASINRTTGVYVATSDINKKKDLEESNIGLSEILQLKPTLYRMKSDNSKGEKELGFVAQEVKGIIPSAYQESGDFIGLNYNPIVAALTKAVQELKAKIDILENK